MNIPAGTTMYIGPPAHPMAAKTTDAIGVALGKIPEIREAHLPQVFVPGKIDPSAQVLVIVLEDGAPSPASRVGQVLREILPTNVYMDVMEWHSNHAALPTVRSCGCALNLRRTLN